MSLSATSPSSKIADLQRHIERKHATSDVVKYVLYTHFSAGRSIAECSQIFKKSTRTIQRWIDKFKRHGTTTRKLRFNPPLKITAENRRWIIALYKKYPTLYLDEVQTRFAIKFKKTISRSWICRIMKSEGYTRQVLERRALEVKVPLILQYAREMRSFKWDPTNLVFLDESSSDNRTMFRHYGYGKKGAKLVYRSEYRRKKRVSVLAFLTYDGVQEVYTTEGTFTRKKFLDCCRKFVNSGAVNVHPGRNSVWIMDGAKIHCSTNIVGYLRSVGLKVVFLPPYCPFYNPIELSFGYVKTAMRRWYVEGSSDAEILRLVGEVFERFTNFNFLNVFRKCGYLAGGIFDPGLAFNQLQND